MLSGCTLLKEAEFYVAVDGKGLWPNLTLLPNGEIAAAVYNHPSHGIGSGSNVELWTSSDGGCFWEPRSTISDLGDEPNGIRMNHAVGLDPDGNLIALISGYHEGQKRPFLPVQCCRSRDDGRTWKRHLLEMDDVPFGDILALPDGRLACAMYRTDSVSRHQQCSIFFSSDGGRSWPDSQFLAENINETSLLRCSNGTWLAAARSSCTDRMDSVLPHGDGELLFRSTDEGHSWSTPKQISPKGQENAHLLQLADGRILCSFTSRIPGLFGVVMRLSEDVGETWSRPAILLGAPFVDWHKTDCGYPSAVQLNDGTIVTAYYFGPKRPEYRQCTLPWHQHYHMGVARWRPDMMA